MTADSRAACPHQGVSLLTAADGPGLPHDLLAEARSAPCPVVWSPADDMYVVTTYDDVRFVLEHPEIFSSRDPNIHGSVPVRLPPLDADLPVQRAFRSLLNPFFTRAFFSRFEPEMRRVAGEAIESWIDAGRCEFMAGFAVPYTSQVLAQLVFEETNRDRLARAVRCVTAVAEELTEEAFFNLAVLAGEYLVEKEEEQSADQGSILGAIVNGTVDGRALTSEEQVGVVTVLFMGGLDTTRGALGTIAAHLATRPGIERRLRDPGWVKHDLEEFIRYDSPVITMARTVVEDVELGGRVLRKGDRLGIHFASANRDQSKFDDAQDLRFDRPRAGHAGFGLGIHRCIGMHLARVQISVAFDELLARITNLRLSSGQVHWAPGVVSAPQTLDLEFDRRPL